VSGDANSEKPSAFSLNALSVSSGRSLSVAERRMRSFGSGMLDATSDFRKAS